MPNPAVADVLREQLEARGAASTVAAVDVVHTKSHLLLRAFVVGDSFVIVHRQSGANKCAPKSWPPKPPFLTSDDAHYPIARALEESQAFSTPLSTGDVVILASDAFAAWYIGKDIDLCRARRERLPAVLDWCQARSPRIRHENFDRWLEGVQHRGEIELDDTTVVVIQVISTKKVARYATPKRDRDPLQNSAPKAPQH
jgi:hypothetical protein